MTNSLAYFSGRLRSYSQTLHTTWKTARGKLSGLFSPFIEEKRFVSTTPGQVKMYDMKLGNCNIRSGTNYLVYFQSNRYEH